MVILDEEQKHVVEVLKEEVDHEVPGKWLIAEEHFVVVAQLVCLGVLGEVGCQLAEHLELGMDFGDFVQDMDYLIFLRVFCVGLW